MELILIIIGLLALVIGSWVYLISVAVEDSDFWWLIIAVLGFTLVLCMGASLYAEAKHPIIIQKSPDTEWELSEAYHIEQDTCITEIRIINQTDTVYPTTCYKVLKP